MSSPQENDAPPSTVEDVFMNIRGRRLGFHRAFFTDVETLHNACDPERENLCLYAYPNGTWEVKVPSELVPSDLPEPVLGINFFRDGLTRIHWLTVASAHSDSWLLSLASFYGSQLTRDQRTVLFDMLNDEPTLYEQVKNESIPSSVEDIFDNISGRRIAFRRALFLDVDTFHAACDQANENLCLYAYPSGTWKVSPPLLNLPPKLPEPVLRINFGRDLLSRKEWLTLVSAHSDSWLLSLAFFYGSRLSKNERKRLFNLINSEPTLHDQMTNTRRRQAKHGSRKQIQK